ncbi:GNAT family N-acetyltransferase [Coriobacteriia bacterium Es71-Z0120]|uniref:GNAT family N-acetyltransferase n=1 Tax=Parvivirga hydrogeniphila TaxID=2939460 RepID=UPI002260E2F6|nr:GNAT family N-acetyltransferase [Parvivirga hydrogeniphila]MCL4078343.1 GNAT family N-acetyltransferase [Parvivirga hydrogeniphila]
MSSRSHALRMAEERDLARVFALARQDGVFASMEELRDAWARAPWTVQVSDAGDVALLDRWREHLPLVAVNALWSPERSVPSHMTALRAVARAHGFDDVLSPFVPEELLDPYVRAGMRVVHTGVTMALRQHAFIASAPVRGVELELADESVLEQLLALDIECFSDFWRYDVRLMREYLGSDRTVIARHEGAIVGYAMCRIDRGHGVIGRLAVAPAHRGHGIGGLLLGDALGYLERQGTQRTVLYTQADNEQAQRLYARFGFEQTGSRKHLLAFGEVDTEKSVVPWSHVVR